VNTHTAETIALRPVSDKQTQLARRLYLEGFAYAALEVSRLSRWEQDDKSRMAQWADYTPTYTPADALREHAINAALMAWDHGEYGHFAQGLAAGYYAALGEEA
jgi:hypothetical protein